MRTKSGPQARSAADRELSRARKLQMLYLLRLTRALDERAHALHKQGKVVGGLYSSLGQEAISVGSAFALRKGDYVGPQLRDMGAVLVRGHTARDVMTQYLARATSPCRGKDNSLHFGDPERTGVIGYTSMLGAMIPVMAGLALGSKLKGEERVAIAYIGDGGSSTGDFYEGLNFAAALRLPLVVVIENNQYSYSTPVSKQTPLKDLADRAKAFGIPGTVGDGNDVLEVYRISKRRAEEARAGGGPQLIEFKTFRMRGHAPHDPAEYVPQELFEEWKARDPIDRLERHLKLADAERRDVDARVGKVVDDAVEFAEKSPFPDGAETLKGVFEDDSIVRFAPWWERG